MQQAEPISQTSSGQINIFWITGVVAVIGIVFSAIGAALDIEHFFRVYLVAFLFWVEISLGGLGLLMVSILVNGRWGYAIQRIGAASARLLPLMFVLFLPILFRLEELYPWATESFTSEGGKEEWLDVTFFAVRSIAYFAIWIVLAFSLTSTIYRYDKTGDERLLRQSYVLSVVGMILFILTGSLAAFDWILSLNKDWFSSIFGWLVISRQALMIMAFALVVLSFVWQRENMKKLLNKRVIADLGTILLVTVMAWAYLNFMEYIVIWSGNTPDKGSWYVMHLENNWTAVALFLVFFHVAVFTVLIIPGLKVIRGFVFGIAFALLAVRLLELYWVVMPHYNNDVELVWWDFALPMAIGGVWVSLFVLAYFQNDILPLNRPDFVEAMEHQEEDE